MDNNIFLSVRDLNVTIGESAILSDVSFDIELGKRLGVAGPSGSGKTMLAWTIIGGQPSEALVDGSIVYRPGGSAVNLISDRHYGQSSVSGKKIAIIPQNPFSSLNPSRTCGDQINEAVHSQNLPHIEVKKLCIETLIKMNFSDPERIYNSYPHQLSGGQLQRVVIAMAIINKPQLLIADEPTTALDAMTTDHILDLMDTWIVDNSASLLLVSHDWRLLTKMCDTIISLQKGRVISISAANEMDVSAHVLQGKENQASAPVPEAKYPTPNLQVDHLAKNFAIQGSGSKKVKAVADVSFSLAQGQSLGVVGESGSGKSTIAKLLTGLEIPDGGTMTFNNQAVNYSENTNLRKEIQMIFQDPYSALYPHRTVGYCITEPLKLHHKMQADARRKKALELMHIVDLDPDYYDRLPGKLSGGERQRVQIARALSVDPKLLICDECVSGLDIPVQARILELLRKLKQERDISIIFISHDLYAVRFICDRLAVMSNGEFVEIGATADILSQPQHEISKNLVSSMALFDE